MTTAAEAPVRLYTTPWCPFCINAKRLLQEKGIVFEDINVAKDPGLRAEASQAAGGWPTVPMIFIKGQFVGGFSELSKLDRSGELTALLTS